MDRLMASRRALGAFVRAHRARLSPAAVGLPGGGRRRTPGLRREELAELCGMSTTWCTWLEQGRDMALGAMALSRLAGALKLDAAERAYLFELAGKRDPVVREAAEDPLPPAVAAAVAAISVPAYVLDRKAEARAWNPPASRLFAGWLDGDNDRNLLRYIFLSPASRRLIADHDRRAARVLAEFRADLSRHVGDAAMTALVDELNAGSPLFARLWAEQDVLTREGGERTFDHPQDGFLRAVQVTWTLAGWPDLKLSMLVPAAAPLTG
ncbi:helix-turn-helix transcriptional regulator [Pseudoxanthobacter sp.]|uniref:helix-turn-helix transcriptional regulator n=1 Tax=Pseudoxanthobacter sp. TaxID=1925742 RepID=UPI002FDFCB0A